MSIRIGRNNQYHCGSNKKYKKCCAVKDDELSNKNIGSKVLDLAWYKLRKLEAVVVDEYLTPYVNRISNAISDDLMMIASEDFFPDNLSASLNKEILFNQFFYPWFLFNWVANQELCISRKEFDPDETISQNYLRLKGSYLSSADREFLKAMNQSYYSFYTVLKVEKEKTLIIKDILLGKTHEIKERQGTHCLNRGDIVFGRVLTLEGQSIFVGMALYMIPVSYNTALINFKNYKLLSKN